MKLDGLHVLILVANGFEDLEFYVPLMRLQEEGARVTVAGITANEPVTGKNGLHAMPRTSIADCSASEYDAIVIPGGWAPDKLRRYDEVKQLVRDFNHAGKVIAMICHGGLVGISAGIVRGHPAVGSEGIKDDLINAGAVWRDEPAFRSDNLVWGRVVADIPDFCRELVIALAEQNSKSLH
ncbi:MAG: type 1 glutamine amidotransferase domain-containing protein [Bellilinea sp.]